MITYDLQALRQKYNKSQEEIADIIGKERTTYTRIEKSGRLKSEYYNLLKIAFPDLDDFRDTSNMSVLRKSNSKYNTKTPVYEIDFMGGLGSALELGTTNPDYYVEIPEFNGCTAFRIFGNSMEPLIKSGSLVFAKKIDNWKEYIELGQIYGIVLKDGRRICKKVKKSPQEGYLRIISENPDFDEDVIRIKDVSSIWLIHGWIVKYV